MNDITKEAVEGLAAKLAPVLASGTEEERALFDAILQRAAGGAEAEGFAVDHFLKIKWEREAAWATPLSAQLAAAAGAAVTVRGWDLEKGQ